MIKKYKIIILFILIFLNLQNKTISVEFFFEGDEIEILNNGNRLLSNENVKVTSTDNLIITANEFDYDKIKSELILKGNVIINDIDNKTIINTEKIKYFRNIEKFYLKVKLKLKLKINT